MISQPIERPRILLITQFFSPETGAGARRVGALARALAAKDDVTVVTMQPSYPTPELFTKQQTAASVEQFPFRIIRIGLFHPHTSNLFLRGLRELVMAARLTLKARGLDADLVLVSTPSMFLGPFSRRLSRRIGARFVWDVRDLTWRYGRESANTGLLGNLLTRLLEGWMVANLKAADLVLAATDGVRQILVAENGLEDARVFTLVNGVSRYFYEAFSECEPRQELPGIVLYLGLLGYNHGIEILTDVARLLPDIRFRIVGDGPMRPTIEQRIQNQQIPNIDLQPYTTNQEKIVRHYQEADILFNHTKDRDVLNRTAVPAKFFEYMATGKPIVYAGKGRAVEFLDSIGCAEVVPPGDPEAIARAIERLLSNPEWASAMGLRGRTAVQSEFIREDLMRSAAIEISHLLSRKDQPAESKS